MSPELKWEGNVSFPLYREPMERQMTTKEQEVGEKGVLFNRPPLTRISLIQQTEEKPRPRKLLAGLVLGAFLVPAAYLTLSFLGERASVRSFEGILQTRQKQAATLERRLADRNQEVRRLNHLYRTREKKRDSLASILRFLKSGLRGRKSRARPLEELARLDFPGIWLESLSVTPHGIFLEGRAARRPLISRFLRALKRSPHFKNVKIQKIQSLRTLQAAASAAGPFRFEISSEER